MREEEAAAAVGWAAPTGEAAEAGWVEAAAALNRQLLVSARAKNKLCCRKHETTPQMKYGKARTKLRDKMHASFERVLCFPTLLN